MAEYYVSKQTGNWGTAGTWNRCSNTDGGAAGLDGLGVYSMASLFSTQKQSQVFTAPSLADSCVGFAIGFIAPTSAAWTATLTVALQEFDGAVWTSVKSKTLVYADFANASSTIDAGVKMAKFAFATPYTYTTLTASYYRFNYSVSASTGAGPNLLRKTSPDTIPTLAIDDRTGVPGASDLVFVVNDLANSTDVVITVDGNQSIGNNYTTSNPTTAGSYNSAVTIGHYGKLNWDTTQNTTLTVKGTYAMFPLSTMEIGSEATPDTFTGILDLDKTSVTAKFEAENATITMWGAPRTTLITTFSSGLGTAASPLITADATDWGVGDEIMLLPAADGATNYTGMEYRFIITKNSSTSFVLSSTSGGAENALTGTHSHSGGNGHILNITRNVKIKSTGSTSSSGTTISLQATATTVNPRGYTIYGASIENCQLTAVILGSKANPTTTIKQPFSVSALIIRYSYAVHNVTITGADSDNYTISNLHILQSQNASVHNAINFFGSYFDINTLVVADAVGGSTTWSGYGSVITNFISSATNSNNDISRSPIRATGCSGVVFVSPIIYCTRSGVLYCDRGNVSSGEIKIFGGSFGVRGKNGTILASGDVDSVILVVFDNCVVDAATTTLVSGGNNDNKYAFMNKNAVVSEHSFRDGLSGEIVSTGAGLTDSTVRTSSSLAMKAAARTTLFPVYSLKFNTLVKANQAASFYFYAKKDATLVGKEVVATMKFPTGSAVVDSVTLTDDTNWNLVFLSAAYSGSVTTLAEIEIIIPYISDTTGFLYIDDIYNGNSSLTALDAWANGRPPLFMAPDIADPFAVWQVANAGFATGTMGELAGKIYTAADDAATLALVS